MLTIFQPIKQNLFCKTEKYKTDLGWYQVENKAGIIFIVLLSAYGAIYITSNGDTTFSSRDYFNTKYTILKELNLKVTIQEVE